MRALGVAIKMRKLNYLVGFAVIEDDRVGECLSLAAPPDLPLAGQLEELHRRARDFADHEAPDLLALKSSEIRGATKQAAVAHRAEGAILAGFGSHPTIRVEEMTGRSMFPATDFTERLGVSNKEIVDALCEQLDAPPEEEEVRQAAAAARAALVRSQ
jgi:hypothetical protein